MKRVLLLLGLVILSFVSSYADQNITSCGTVINSVDNYFLNQSINASSGTCIEFQGGASGSTLNCQGFSINNNGSASIGIYIDSEDIIFSNCVISSFNNLIDYEISSHNVILDNFSYFGMSNIIVSGSNISFKNSSFIDINAVIIYNSVNNISIDGSYFNGSSHILNEGSSGSINNNIFDYNKPIPTSFLDRSHIKIDLVTGSSNFTYSNLNFFNNATFDSIGLSSISNNLFENISLENSDFIIDLDISTSSNNTFNNITGNRLIIEESYNSSFYEMNFENTYLFVGISPSNFDINSNVFRNSNLGNLELDYAINNSFINTSFTNITSFNWSQTPNFFENNSYAQGIVNSSGCIIVAQPEVVCDTGSWSVFSPVVISPSSTTSLFPVFGLVNIIILLGGLFLYFM